jgi:hypothetical protein
MFDERTFKDEIGRCSTIDESSHRLVKCIVSHTSLIAFSLFLSRGIAMVTDSLRQQNSLSVFASLPNCFPSKSIAVSSSVPRELTRSMFVDDKQRTRSTTYVFQSSMVRRRVGRIHMLWPLNVGQVLHTTVITNAESNNVVFGFRQFSLSYRLSYQLHDADVHSIGDQPRF